MKFTLRNDVNNYVSFLAVGLNFLESSSLFSLLICEIDALSYSRTFHVNIYFNYVRNTDSAKKLLVDMNKVGLYISDTGPEIFMFLSYCPM